MELNNKNLELQSKEKEIEDKLIELNNLKASLESKEKQEELNEQQLKPNLVCFKFLKGLSRWVSDTFRNISLKVSETHRERPLRIII